MTIRFDPPYVRYDAAEESLVVEAAALGVHLSIGPFRKGAPLRVFVDGRVETSWDDPDLPLFSGVDALAADHPVRVYLETLPAAARPHVARFHELQLSAIRLMALGDRAIELVASAPNLVWLVLPATASLSRRQLAALVFERRVDLLARATGRPGTAEMRCFVERFAPERRTAYEREILLRALRRPPLLHAFRHAPLVTTARVRAATGLSEWLHLPAVRTAIFESERPLDAYAVPELARDCHRLGRALGIPAADFTAAVRRTRTVGELRALHDRWAARARALDDEGHVARVAKAHGTETFPPPPVPGTSEIVHVGTVGELLREGREMHHCVGSYAEDCLLGTSFIYRVLAPERATLEIRVRDGRVVVKQIKLACNRAPAAATVAAVRGWLVRAGGV